MSARSKSFVLLLVGLYVLAWAVYPFGGLMAVHPITWFELFVALLCITMAVVELVSRNTAGDRHDLQIRLTGTFVTLYLAGAFALLFIGGFSGFWTLSEGDAPAKYLFVVVGVGLPLLPVAVLVVSRLRHPAPANSALQPTRTAPPVS